MKLSHRPTVVYDLPLQKDTVITRPESAIVRFSHGLTVDLGALCYLRREYTIKRGQMMRKKGKGRMVDLNSLNVERTVHVHALIVHLSDNLMHSGRRTETVRADTTRFVVFMSWADQQGYYHLLNNVEAARTAVRAYANHIRERVTTNAISINSGARQQSAVFGLLGEFLDVDNLTRGINLLRISRAAKVVTVPPDEDAQAKVLGLCESLFEGLTSLVLDGKSYPYALALPKYLNYPANTLWLFPTTSWFMSPHMQVNRKSFRGYNYSAGRPATMDELRAMKDFAADDDKIRKQVIKSAERQFATANSNLRHAQRLNVGMHAVNVFIMQFLAQTGMNWAQVINLPWADDYEVGATHQIFRTIKWRANNREVSFELPAAFMPKFKRYLELRKYLLDGRPCNWLFFRLGLKGLGEPAQIKTGPATTYMTLQRIDPELPAVMPRQWRAAKSDWLIRNTDPSTAALVLQNSEKTVLASYAAGSEMSHVEEMSDFLDKVSETVVEKGLVIEGGVIRAVGVCTAYGAPNKTAGQNSVQADCKGPEGCLFCDKFKVHADEIDTRKLISCRYCLRQTAPLAGSEERFRTLLGPILNRIDVILNEVSRRDESLVFKVTKEVEEDGELDTYWAHKLEMLLDLGLVA